MKVAQTKFNPKPRRDAVEILRVRQRETRRIINNLQDSDAPEAVYLSEVLSQTVADQNLFVGLGMTNAATGEKFDGFDALAMSASRLSPLYVRQQSRRARKRAIGYLSRVQPAQGERWMMLTLTMPRLRGFDFIETKAVFDDALRRFRQSLIFKNNVRGGIKSEEFTLGKEFEDERREWSQDDGFHIHAHFVLCSRWLSWLETGETWKKCLQSSADRFGIQIHFKTAHGRPVVHLRHVTAKGKGKDSITFADAVTEATKYVTKGSNFEKLPASELLKIESALRGRRLLESLGEANQRKGSETVTLSTGFITSDNEPTEKETTNAGERHHLDTQNTIESLNLRKRCLKLIRAGEIEAFRRLVSHEFEKRRAFRRRHLAMTFPDAEFFTLDGEVFSFKTVDISPEPYRHLKLV
jgi:hypothetical protein